MRWLVLALVVGLYCIAAHYDAADREAMAEFSTQAIRSSVVATWRD